MLFLKFLLIIICVEAITELLSKSEFFMPLRKYLFEKQKPVYRFLHDIIDCPYCLSVWVSVINVVYFYFIFKYTTSIIFMFIPMVLVFHRMSNILHFIIDKLRGSVS